MSCSKLICLKPAQLLNHQALRSLSSLSEIRQSSNKSKATGSIKSDIVVLGDGILANSIAYWLRATNIHNESVLVVENENFKQNKFNVPCSSQFSVEGVQLSKFTNKFIRRINSEFKLRPNTEHDAQSLQENGLSNHDDLCEHNSAVGLLQVCENIADEIELIRHNKLFKQLFGSNEYTGELLNSKQLNEMFSWLNGENVRVGRFHGRDDLSLTNINLNQLNEIFQKKARKLGVQYMKGEFKNLNSSSKYEEDDYGVMTLKKDVNEMTINRCLDQDLIGLTKLKFKKLIVATSADKSRVIGNMLGLDKNSFWPVEDRSRFIYEIKCNKLKNENIPIVFDEFGLWLKKDQLTGNFYCGFNNQEKLIGEDLNKVTIFSKYVWPKLTTFLPALSQIEMVKVHEQTYDYNLIDDSGVIGEHPEISNLYWVLGFNGTHEIWSPGIGRAVVELINHKRFNSINLDKLSWKRAINSSRFKQRLSN